jgi:protein-disulfide isomerase
LAAATGAAALGSSMLAGPASAQEIKGFYDDLPMPDMAMGKDDAPVTLVEYASMTCPHCKTFHEGALKKLKETYVVSGKVRVIFREFPLDNLAAAAAMLARCAPGDNYFPMLDVLFAQQEQWSRSDDPVSELLRISRLGGFSEESFKACLGNQEVLNGISAIRSRASKLFDIRGTPTVFLNGAKYSGDLSYKSLTKAIDALQ